MQTLGTKFSLSLGVRPRNKNSAKNEPFFKNFQLIFQKFFELSFVELRMRCSVGRFSLYALFH